MEVSPRSKDRARLVDIREHPPPLSEGFIVVLRYIVSHKQLSLAKHVPSPSQPAHAPSFMLRGFDSAWYNVKRVVATQH